MKLVPHWRHAWKWFSVQAAVVATLLGLIEAGARSAQENPLFAWLTAQPWFAYIVPAAAALAAVLRLVHQPVEVVDDPAPADTPVSPQPMEQPDVNTNFSNILAAIPGLVISAEQAFKGTPGSGADKAAAVTGIVAPMIPTGESDGMKKVQAVMMMALAFYNAVHPMFQKQTAAPATTPPQLSDTAATGQLNQ